MSTGQQALDPSGPRPDETIPPGEAAALQRVVASIADRVRAAGLPAHRDAHPKAHGCVRARFTVRDDVPPALRAGVFAHPRTFDAWARFSNGNGTPQPDRIGDGRGMAIKLMDVPDSPSGTQDFVMINAPRFFVRNVADYVDFQDAAPQWRFFFPGLNPLRFRLHEFIAAVAITRKKVSNPLNTRYWSMTPMLCGDAACKYSAQPVGTPSTFVSTTADNYLHDNLSAQLAQGDAQFDFMLQVRGDPSRMPVEDPTIEWSETASVFIPVAHVTIGAQQFGSPEQQAFCENLSFTPWHCVPAHRPLGGINRMRRVVYDTISALRHGLNGVERHEPTGKI